MNALYAITPRFAPTSTPEQLERAGQLKQEFPDVYVHTHLSENKDEIAWVKSLFPEQAGYLDVYQHYGLTGKRSVFAHCNVCMIRNRLSHFAQLQTCS